MRTKKRNKSGKMEEEKWEEEEMYTGRERKEGTEGQREKKN
jgi:hypothetical protein